MAIKTSAIIETVVITGLLLGLYYKTSVFLVLVQIIVFGGMVVGLYQKNTNLMCKSKKILNGMTVIVTGGTSGMGLEIAADFAHRGAKVIVACPFEDEGLHAKARIEKSSGSKEVIFKLLDLSSLKSIREFAADILRTEDRLDILLNNAGVGIPGDFLTSDGMNFIMQVNYYGTFLLTLLLLPLLKKTGQPSEPSRIVNTSSVLHKIGKVELKNMNKTNYWSKMRIYGNSKLCLVMFTHELSRRLNGTNVIVHTVDPGAVGTAIFHRSGLSLAKIMTFLIGILFKHPWEGSQTALYVCLSNTVAKSSGKYFKNLQTARAAKAAYEEDMWPRVWEQSIKLVKLTDDELRACDLLPTTFVTNGVKEKDIKSDSGINWFAKKILRNGNSVTIKSNGHG